MRIYDARPCAFRASGRPLPTFLGWVVLLATLILGSAAATAAEVELPTPPGGALPAGAPPETPAAPAPTTAPAPETAAAPGTAPAAPATASVPLVLRMGVTGQSVRDLQRELRRRGQRVVVDGAYGPGTRTAVRALQRRLSLRPTGVADTALLRRLGISSRSVASGPGAPLAPVPQPIGVPGAARYLRVFPVNGPHRFQDDYGDARGQGAHQGNDIMAARGTPVVAVADGTIQRLTRTERGLGGIYVYLLDRAGNSYYYAHLDSIEVGIEEGTRVAAGQQIATVGNTGDARYGGHHLHFEIHPGDGGAINPYTELRAVDTAPTPPAS